MKKENSAIRNEQITDIIERMPTKFGKWVAISVFLFFIIIMILGWIIKYPDIVTGQITINSTVSPIKLVAGGSGKIRLLHFQARDQVKEDDYIAVIQNSARTEDVKKIMKLLSGFDPNQAHSFSITDSMPEKVSLGELNLKYFSFLTTVKNICQYQKENTYTQQRKNLESYIQWQKVLLKQTENDTLTSGEKLALIRKWLKRKTDLYQKEMITEKEFDDLKTSFLNVQSENQQLHKAITTIHIQMSEAEGKLNVLKTEQTTKEQQMHMELISAYNDLTNNIKIWEQRYVFKAPFDGQVEYLKFLADNQYIQAGEEVFSIIPQNNIILGQMQLPAQGAGKVSLQSSVIVRLDNYPYMEYGSIQGYVNNISLVTNEQNIANNPLETYLINISLPEGLTTNYGKELEFKYEIKGSADIIVNDRRLIERLFDNLRYRVQ